MRSCAKVYEAVASILSIDCLNIFDNKVCNFFLRQEYNYVFGEPAAGVFYGYQSYYPGNGCQYLPCAEQQV